MTASPTESGTAPGAGLARTCLVFFKHSLSTAISTLSLHVALPISAALTISSFGASGDFAATSSGANACPTSPATLAAGANCTIDVTFTPTVSGARTGTLSVVDNAGGSPQSVALIGNGTAAPTCGLPAPHGTQNDQPATALTLTATMPPTGGTT